jgi:hypothetical protein
MEPLRLLWGWGAAPLVVIVVAMAALLSWPVGGQPAHWQRVGRDWGDSRTESAARSGGHGLHVADSHAREWQYLQQTVTVNGGDSVHASAWVRAASPGGAAQLVLNDDRGTWLSDTAEIAEEWTRLTVNGVLADEAESVRLAVVPGTWLATGTGELDVDDVSLAVDGIEVLVNGGAESPRRLGSLLVSGAARYTDIWRVARHAAVGLSDPVTSAARTWRAVDFLFRSYWGGFGWLTVWPPTPIPQGRYLLTAVVPLFLPAVALADRIARGRGPLALCGLALTLDLLLVVWVIWPSFRLQL